MLLLAWVLPRHRRSRVPGVFAEARRRQQERNLDKIGVIPRLMEATLRDELRIALRRRGLPTSLVKRLMRGNGAQALTEEAAAAPLIVRRRLGSRPGGLALTEDAGATGWIVEACKENSVLNDVRGAIWDVRRWRTRLNDLR